MIKAVTDRWVPLFCVLSAFSVVLLWPSPTVAQEAKAGPRSAWQDLMDAMDAISKPGPSTLIVNVPEGAKVFVGDKEIAYSGRICKVISGNKQEPGIAYIFKVRVVFASDGKQIQEIKRARMYAHGTTELDFTDIVKPNRKRRTYGYWNEVIQISNAVMKEAGGKDVKPEKMASVLKIIAQEVDALPTRGVDEDAITVMQDLSEVFGKMAKFGEENAGTGRVVEAFFRGVSGDPFGVAREVSAEQKAITQQFQRLQIKLKRTRAILTSRYDIEFPKVD